MVQYGYERASPYIQRNIRRYLAQRKRDQLLADVAYLSLHAAACAIQTMVRRSLQRERYRILRLPNYEALATKIQKIYRGHCARRRYRVMYEAWVQDRRLRACVLIQAAIRGFLSRRIVKQLKELLLARCAEEARDWAAVIIQRFARGYIARKKTLRSLKIRQRLSRDVLQMASRYLEHGDLWGFLQEVDQSFKKLNDDLRLTKELEETYAQTFIDKVLSKRKAEFDGAWGRFSAALNTKVKATAPKRGGNSVITKNEDALEDSLSAISLDSGFEASFAPSVLGPARKERRAKAKGNVQKVQGLPAQVEGSEKVSDKIHNAIPGSALRRAITATVKDRVAAELATTKLRGTDMESVRRTYADEQGGPNEHQRRRRRGERSDVRKSSAALVTDGRRTNARAGRQSSVESNLSSASLNWMTLASSPQRSAAVDAGSDRSRSLSPVRNSALPPPSKGKRRDRGSAGRTANATREEKHTRSVNTQATSVSAVTDASSIGTVAASAGDTLLLDIPLGLEDSVDRLLRAASLRCYVPDFFPHDSPESAYAIFLRMPPGLSRIRYEQAAWGWAQPFIDRLRLKRLYNIRDLLPPSKMRIFLRGVESPVKLTDCAIDIVHTLKRTATVSVGLTHAPTLKKKKLLNVLLETNEPFSVSASDNSQLMYNSTAVPTAVNSVGGGDSIPGTHVPVDEDNLSMQEKYYGSEIDALVTDKMLQEILTEGMWARLKADADSLIIHAAFIVAPHVTLVDVLQPDYDLKKYLFQQESLMTGQAADYVGLKDHLNEIQRLRSEEDRKIVMRARLDQAKEMVGHVLQCAKGYGMRTVYDLVRSDLTVLGMHPCLREQVDQLLNVVVAGAIKSKARVNARILQQPLTISDSVSKRGRSKANSEPLMFDPRFQRSPFDPYGCPPRTLNLKALLKEEDARGQRLDKMAAAEKVGHLSEKPLSEDLPPGLWASIKHQETEGASNQESKKAEELYRYESSKVLDRLDETAYSSQYTTNTNSNATKKVKFGTMLCEDPSEDENEYDGSDIEERGDSSRANSVEKETVINKESQVEASSQTSSQTSSVRFMSPATAPTITSSPERRNVSRGKLLEESVGSASSPALFPKPQWQSTAASSPAVYKCSHVGCGQEFSRAYTLKVHEKSHELFPSYHNYKNTPMLNLDPDVSQMIAENRLRRQERTALPRIIMQDLESLRTHGKLSS